MDRGEKPSRFDKIVRNNFEHRRHDDGPQGVAQEARSNPYPSATNFKKAPTTGAFFMPEGKHRRNG